MKPGGAERGEVRRNPVPSLLRSLLSEHLDPGYADEARLKAEGHRRPPSRIATVGWLVAGTLAIGLVFGVSGAHQASLAPDTAAIQSQIADDVRGQQESNRTLATARDDLAERESRERSAKLADGEVGARLLAELHGAEVAAGARAQEGEGLRVTIAEPARRPDLSDRARLTDNNGGQAILDRDLQSVVNALWASGAEAIAVGGVRIGPSVTIRQAGGAILVDNQPVPNPYVVEAIGDPSSMQSAYIVSPAFLRLQTIEQLYGASVSISTADDLRLPAAPARELRYASGG